MFIEDHARDIISTAEELLVDEGVVVGEVAYTRARDSLSVIPIAGGEAKQLAGHRVTVWRKQPDGSWLLARDAALLGPN